MKTHIFHFIILLCILGIGTAMFFYAQGNRSVQLLIGIITSVSYVIWGLVHHTMQGDLHRKVVIEYVLIGVIAILLLTTFLGS